MTAEFMRLVFSGRCSDATCRSIDSTSVGSSIDFLQRLGQTRIVVQKKNFTHFHFAAVFRLRQMHERRTIAIDDPGRLSAGLSRGFAVQKRLNGSESCSRVKTFGRKEHCARRGSRSRHGEGRKSGGKSTLVTKMYEVEAVNDAVHFTEP